MITFKDMLEIFLSKFGLKMHQKYQIKEIIDRVIEGGNGIKSVLGHGFDSDLYQGVKDQMDTEFKKRFFLNLLIEEDRDKEDFKHIIDHLSDEVIISDLDILPQGQSGHLFALIGEEGQSLMAIEVPDGGLGETSKINRKIFFISIEKS